MGNLLDLVTNVTIGHIKRNFWEGFYDTYHLMMRPIGLLSKSYNFLYDNLTRNIGNVQFTYDGYGTPIGGISDPFYNTISLVPWFISDTDKNSYPNYIEYVKAVYGATLSVENINSVNTLNNIEYYVNNFESTRVAAIKTDAVTNGNGTLNPNTGFDDTKLGKLGYKYSNISLSTAIKINDKRNNQGITATLSDYYGLKENPIENGILTEPNVYGLLTNQVESPITYLNTKEYKPVGINNDKIYDDFINSLGYKNSEKYKDSIKERDNFRIKKGYNSWDYLASDFITKYVDGKRYNLSINDDNAFNFGGTLGIYNEDTDASNYDNNGGVRFSRYAKFSDDLDSSSLLAKTNQAFKNGEYGTIIGKFNTGKKVGQEEDALQTAISSVYGMSHGRNLLKEDAVKSNEKGGYEASSGYSSSYDNPYCRVWTYHHQYKSLSDAIRPFAEKDDKGNYHIISQSQLATQKGFNQFEANNELKDGFENGRTRLGKFGVLNNHNGLVNISPLDDADPEKSVDIKNCMFSIENLAWKDTLTGKTAYNIETLSKEQKGPFGGRIMWFPPYDLRFNEDVSVNWAETNFIGRGEGIYTYKNTKRTGSLSFKLLIDHPSILNYWTNAEPPGDNTVDDVKGAEQELLRFFAGCDFLTPKVAPKPEEEIGTVDEPIDSPNTETFTFYVFFPNNYSGVDDSAEKAMDYLANGYATWKTKDGDYYSPSNTSTAVLLQKETETQIGGYEMRPGISLNYPFTAKDYGKSDEIGTVRYGNSKIVSFHVINKNGSDVKYYYRIDDKYATEPLTGGNANYMDLSDNSVCLNSKYGLDDVRDFAGGKRENVFSFADFYVAMKEELNIDTFGELFSPGNYNLLRKRIKFNKKNVVSVECIGSASSPGKDNKNLAKNRARTVKNWRTSGEIKLCSGGKIKVGTTDDFSGGDNDINSVMSKLYRHVRVDIKVKTEETITAQNNEMDLYSFIGSQKKSVQGIGIPLDNKTKFIDFNANINHDKSAVPNPNDIKLDYSGNFNNKLGFNIRGNDVIGLKTEYNLPGVNDFLTDTQRWLLSKDKQTYMHANEKYDTDKEEMESRGGYNTNSDGEDALGNGIGRYEGEAKFFKLLELKDPFMHHKISEKVKYFDPAFHSVSPEGFNARLTFLQQCCRQGPTNGATDSGAENTANNLAFGRPPVCILRIGDFFYTKIVIEGVTIDYNNNGLQWDLNPEGIGVMPMMADVTMRFTFIGGSSLAGPISRLQNALSFNMYANTEVYDDRAELADYDDDGNITKFAPFNPSV